MYVVPLAECPVPRLRDPPIGHGVAQSPQEGGNELGRGPEPAVRLHQDGLVPTGSWLFDLDAIAHDRRTILVRSDQTLRAVRCQLVRFRQASAS